MPTSTRLWNVSRSLTSWLPKPEDIVIDKLGYGAFHGTKLDELLRQRGVESLIVTGTVTQICVEETAREAFHYGYKTTACFRCSLFLSSRSPRFHLEEFRAEIRLGLKHERSSAKPPWADVNSPGSTAKDQSSVSLRCVVIETKLDERGKWPPGRSQELEWNDVAFFWANPVRQHFDSAAAGPSVLR